MTHTSDPQGNRMSAGTDRIGALLSADPTLRSVLADNPPERGVSDRYLTQLLRGEVAAALSRLNLASSPDDIGTLVDGLTGFGPNQWLLTASNVARFRVSNWDDVRVTTADGSTVHATPFNGPDHWLWVYHSLTARIGADAHSYLWAAAAGEMRIRGHLTKPGSPDIVADMFLRRACAP